MSEAEVDQWIEEIFNRTAPKIKESNSFAALVTENFIQSPKCAFEIGMAIIFGKPIVLVVKEGVVVPPKLELVAEKVFWFKDEKDLDGVRVELERYLDKRS